MRKQENYKKSKITLVIDAVIYSTLYVLSLKALQRLRGWDDVDSEMAEMHLEDESEKADGRLSVLSLLSQRSLRWQLVSIIIMNMGQQLSGVNAVRRACPVDFVATLTDTSETDITSDHHICYKGQNKPNVLGCSALTTHTVLKGYC